MDSKTEIRIRDLIGIEIISFLVTTVVYTASLVIADNINYDRDMIEISVIISNLIVIIMLLRKSKVNKEGIKRLYKDFKLKLNFKEMLGRYINAGVLNLGSMYLIIGIFIFTNIDIANKLINTSSTEEILYNGTTILNTISIVIIAPILEELIYRKVIFKRLAKKTNTTIAVILSSIIFGIGHSNDSILFAILFGVILCILYLKYENILIPMFLHFFNNLVATTITLFPSKDSGNEVITLLREDSFVFLIVGVIGSIIGLYFYIKYIKKNRKYLKNEKLIKIDIMEVMDMKSKIKKQVNLLQNDLVNSVVEAVKLPSVIGESSEKYPFGKDIDNSLRHTLALCDSLGFKTVYKDGYYGYAEIGQGDEIIGILGHLDVVPEGELDSWEFPPYDGVINDNKIYGRGSQDDKGPTIASLYAIKALMDLGVEFNKRIRVIFGTDEENLWRCINKYKENNEEIPNYGFTPDSKFPMINAEKGLLQCLLSSKEGSDIELSLGNAFNSVPDKAMYKGQYSEELCKELDKLNFEYKLENEKLYVLGKSVHSAVSDTGINAIARLCIALNNIGVKNNAVKFIAEVIAQDANANNIMLNCQDDTSGKLTFNIGKLNINNEKSIISIDVRMPVTCNKDEFVKKLINKAKEYNLNYEEYDYLQSIHVPKDNFLVKTLQRVFEEETSLDGTPLSSGGATYARALDNCVAFGSVFPGKPKVEHQANEYIDINDLIKATEIYALSIYELLQG